MARLEGKSSLGRLGLLIHSTAGFIDPGWDGHVTLELSNVANLPITIYPEMKIGQLSFVQLAEPTDHPYGSSGLGSKYQGQRGPDPEPVLANFERRPRTRPAAGPVRQPPNARASVRATTIACAKVAQAGSRPPKRVADLLVTHRHKLLRRAQAGARER